MTTKGSNTEIKLQERYEKMKTQIDKLRKKRKSKPNQINLAEWLLSLGELEIALDKQDDARRNLEESYKLLMDAEDIENEAMQVSLYYLSMLYAIENRFESAIDCLERHQEIRAILKLPHDENTVKVLDNLATFYEIKDGNNKNSLPIREELAAVFNDVANSES